MEGNITKYREDLGFGVIEGSDGRKFRFNVCDVSNPCGELVGQEVDFLVEARRPKSIIVMEGSLWTAFGTVSA